MVAEHEMVHIRSALFLDVATKYTGYSLFTFCGQVQPGSFMLSRYGNVKAKTSDEWEVRCITLARHIKEMFTLYRPDMLVCEFPSFQGGARGAAASRSGGTLELAYLCGCIDEAWLTYVATLHMKSGGKIRLPLAQHLTFNEWNGQLTKEITCHRLMEKFGVEADPHTIENNFADAIMMGDYFLTARLNALVSKGSADAKRQDIG